MQALDAVASREGLSLPKPLAARLAAHSAGNVRRAMLMLEAAKIQQYPFSPTQSITTPDWERYLQGIAVAIVTEQSPAKFVDIRARLYELLVNCIPADVIINHIAKEVCDRVPEAAKFEVTALAAKYEHQLLKASKELFQIEAFVARVMQTITRARAGATA